MDLCCHQCQHMWSTKLPVGRGDECPQCGWDVRVCLNCENYDAAYQGQCREPQADLVQEKDRANFCDFFSPKLQGTEQTTTEQDYERQNNRNSSQQHQKGLEQLEQLFTQKNSPAHGPAATERARSEHSLADEVAEFLKRKQEQ